MYKPWPEADRKNILTNEKGELIRLSLSPSKLLTFDECKDKFRSVILKTAKDSGSIYTAVGTAAHYVVEQINKGAVLTPSEREDLLRAKLIDVCATEKIDLNFPPSFKEAREILKKYKVPDGYKFVHGEALQQLEFELYTFRYVIDAVLMSEDEKEVIIIDYKTNAAVPKSNLQLLLYAWATSIRMPEIRGKKIRAAFHMLRTDKMVYTDVDQGTIDGMQSYMDTSVGLIEKLFRLKYFPTDNKSGGCHWCPLVDCPDRVASGRY